MDAFKNIGLIDYFKRYGRRFGIQRGIFTISPIHIVKDYSNRKVLYYRKVEKKIKHKYFYAASIDPKGLKYGDISCDNPVWIYWNRGIENAPDIVKTCIQSVRKNSSNEVILITDKNVSDYVIFPDYINKKRSKGNISVASFSDLLRFSLLEHFGGTWIDATVYLTDKLPEYITNSELFTFRDSLGEIRNSALMSVWFLHSVAGNNMIRETRNIAFEYWKYQDYVLEYLLSNIILTIVLENNPVILSDMPYACSNYCYLMMNEIDKKYDKAKYEHIIYLSSIHKLSYKLQENVYYNEENLYHKIVEK